MLKAKPLFIKVISVLMLAATMGRELLLLFEVFNPYRWVIAGLLFLFGVLLFSEFKINRFYPAYLKVYFLIQTGIIITLLLLPLVPKENPKDNDFFALLFIPLCAQAIFYFKKPVNFYWVFALAIASVTALQIQYGLNQGLRFSLTYIIAYAAVGFLSTLYIDADDAKNKLNSANRKLQESSEKIEELAIAEERNRLARDLHDSVTQSLYSLTLFAEAASEELSSGNTTIVENHLQDLRQTSQEALQEMRLMIFELRPPELELKGFVLALQERLETVESRTTLETITSFEFNDRLPINIELGLYGIAREALNNILKHARATKVNISLVKRDEKIVFEIQDDGVGIEPVGENSNSGLGVKGMKERAAQIGANLILENALNGGTLLRVEVPDGGNN